MCSSVFTGVQNENKGISISHCKLEIVCTLLTTANEIPNSISKNLPAAKRENNAKKRKKMFLHVVFLNRGKDFN